MGMTDKIKIALVTRHKTAADLAKSLDCTPVNVYNKFKRDNFSEKELREIASILGYDVEISFIDRETGAKI